ncbi:hypothetical protein [Streptomyces sp. NPDC098781]|uniref:hypothetical protein n=1 Tax=Streptomyces sp. NPDC098781 TaxID=3366097 RepID=UPI00380215BB
MPAPTTRHLVTSTLCAALFLGTVAPALAAAPGTGRDTRTASRAPVPARAVLKDQTEVLAGLGTVLTPVTHLLDRALEADDDPLTAAEAKELADAAKEAVAEARKDVEEARKEAEEARKEALQARKDALAEAKKEVEEARKEALTDAAEADQVPAATTDLTGDALGDLGKTLDALLSVLTSGGSEEVDATADNVVEALVNVTVATLADRGLPRA